MESGTLQIKLLSRDISEQLMNLNITVSTTDHSSFSVDIFSYKDEITHLATELMAFPKDIKHEVLFQYGEDNPKIYSMMELKFYVWDKTGQGCMRFSACNNAKEPYYKKASFPLFADVSSINDLGKYLAQWIENPGAVGSFVFQRT